MAAEKRDSTLNGNCCCICLRSLDTTQDALVSFPCQHSIHLICSITALVSSGNSNCPLCRAPMQRRALGIEIDPSTRGTLQQNTNLASILDRWVTPDFGDLSQVYGSPFCLINQHHGLILTELDERYEHKVVQRKPKTGTRSGGGGRGLFNRLTGSNDDRAGQFWQVVGNNLLCSVTSGRYLSIQQGFPVQNSIPLITTEEPKCKFEYIEDRKQLIHLESEMCVENGGGDPDDKQQLWLWTSDGDPWQYWEKEEWEQE